MKGKHSIVVRNRRVQFALELERNITVIRGDSATGKTTMLGMLRDYDIMCAVKPQMGNRIFMLAWKSVQMIRPW